MKRDPQIPFVFPAHAVYPVFRNPILGSSDLLFKELSWQEREKISTPRPPAPSSINAESIPFEPSVYSSDPLAPNPYEKYRVSDELSQTATLSQAKSPAPQLDLDFLSWMQRPLSAAEINQVLGDFNIHFSPETGIPPLLIEKPDGRFRLRSQYYAEASLSSNGFVGSGDGGFVSPLTLFVKSFLLLDYIKFKVPLPIIGINPYTWLKELSARGLTYIITDLNPVPGSLAFVRGGTDVATMKTSGLRYNRWSVILLAEVLLHEARHTAAGGGKGHDCTWQDTNLEFQGAYAVGYWWIVGCLIYGIRPPIDDKTLRGFYWMVKGSLCEPFQVPEKEFARLEALVDQQRQIPAIPIGPVPVIPVAPGGAAVTPGSATYNMLVSPLTPPPGTALHPTLSETQLRQIVRPFNNIRGAALQNAVSETIGLPWEVINYFLHVS